MVAPEDQTTTRFHKTGLFRKHCSDCLVSIFLHYCPVHHLNLPFFSLFNDYCAATSQTWLCRAHLSQSWQLSWQHLLNSWLIGGGGLGWLYSLWLQLNTANVVDKHCEAEVTHSKFLVQFILPSELIKSVTCPNVSIQTTVCVQLSLTADICLPPTHLLPHVCGQLKAWKRCRGVAFRFHCPEKCSTPPWEMLFFFCNVVTLRPSGPL